MTRLVPAAPRPRQARRAFDRQDRIRRGSSGRRLYFFRRSSNSLVSAVAICLAMSSADQVVPGGRRGHADRGRTDAPGLRSTRTGPAAELRSDRRYLLWQSGAGCPRGPRWSPPRGRETAPVFRSVPEVEGDGQVAAHVDPLRGGNRPGSSRLAGGTPSASAARRSRSRTRPSASDPSG